MGPGWLLISCRSSTARSRTPAARAPSEMRSGVSKARSSRSRGPSFACRRAGSSGS
nr:TPA_asm: M98 iORF 1 RNA 2 [Murid betaherpesvirus 1]DBA07863.1 TPA_asm: M98 iORF 1 RNA 2 [Murid betaherpesvirus 1]